MGESELGLYVIRMLVSLGVILALILVLAAVARRYLPLAGVGRGGRSARIELLELRPIDRQNRIALVRVEERTWLLGLGASGVQALGSWHEGEADSAARQKALEVESSSAGGES